MQSCTVSISQLLYSEAHSLKGPQAFTFHTHTPSTAASKALKFAHRWRVPQRRHDARPLVQHAQPSARRRHSDQCYASRSPRRASFPVDILGRTCRECTHNIRLVVPRVVVELRARDRVPGPRCTQSSVVKLINNGRSMCTSCLCVSRVASIE